MKKSIIYISILATSFMFLTGCQEAQTPKKSKVEEETKVIEESVVIEEKPVNTNVYDGINRIAITFVEDTTTQIGLSWYTPNRENFGNDIEVLDKKTGKSVDIQYEVECGEAEYDDESMYHQTAVKGLKPGTEYYYRIGNESTKQWSEYGEFKTSSSDVEEFSFVALTDTQSAHLPDAFFSADTMKRAVETAMDPAFIMHSGDFVDDGDEEELWLAQMNSAKHVMMNNIIAPAVGNHEEDEHSFWQHFKLEHTNDHKTTGIYYSYDYGNVHFVVLDTNKENDEGTSYIDDEQLEWLEDDLKKANENGTKWIIVNMHKGIYTLGEHADNEKHSGENGARLRVGKVFEENGVDLVIQGHDHCPSVTKPIVQGEVNENGIIYINTGAAGAKAYEVEYEEMPEEYYELFDYQASADRDDDVYQNFAVIDVNNDELNVKMYEINQIAIENNMYTIAEFSIENR